MDGKETAKLGTLAGQVKARAATDSAAAVRPRRPRYQLNEAETRWVVSRFWSLGKSPSSPAKKRWSAAA